MFFIKFKAYVSLFLFLTVALVYSHAQASDKFTKMDTDSSNSISWAEFEKQYPQMKKLAFDSIDTDKNSDISKDEWNVFQDSHSMDRAKSSGQMQNMKGKSMGDGKPQIFMNAPAK